MGAHPRQGRERKIGSTVGQHRPQVGVLATLYPRAPEKPLSPGHIAGRGFKRADTLPYGLANRLKSLAFNQAKKLQ